MKKLLAITAITVVTICSCTKEKMAEYDPGKMAELSVEFDNVVGSTDLQLSTGTYTNGVGESFKISRLKYFVSNFKLTGINGTIYTVPQNESYFLVEESDPASRVPKLSVPEGEYKSVSFMIGVDSLRNTMDVSQRTGVLDVSAAAADMYWSWNSGYIFFRLDGTSPVIPSLGGVFQYHIGGYGGYNSPTTNNLKTFTIDLTSRGTAKVKTGKATNIHLMVDILKAVSGTNNLSFTTNAMVHSPTAGAAVANNYVHMISHLHTEN